MHSEGTSFRRADAVTVSWPLNAVTDSDKVVTEIFRRDQVQSVVSVMQPFARHIRQDVVSNPGCSLAETWFCEVFLTGHFHKFLDFQELESCVGEELWTEKFKQGTLPLWLIEKPSAQYPVPLGWSQLVRLLVKSRLNLSLFLHSRALFQCWRALSYVCRAGSSEGLSICSIKRYRTRFCSLLGRNKAVTFYQKKSGVSYALKLCEVTCFFCRSELLVIGEHLVQLSASWNRSVLDTAHHWRAELEISKGWQHLRLPQGKSQVQENIFSLVFVAIE